MKEGLFNKPIKSTIQSYNLSGDLLNRKASNFRFRLSVYGVLIENNAIVFHINPDINELCIPGGGVEIDETMEEALTREFLEETGIQVEISKQLITIEDFFTFQDDDAHSVLVFYLVHRKSNTSNVDIASREESSRIEFVKIEEIKSRKIQRVFNKFFGLIDIGLLQG